MKGLQTLDRATRAVSLATAEVPQVAELDQEALLESIRFAEQLFPGRVVVLCHLKHQTSPYVSSNCKQILGYSEREFKGFSPESFLTLVHPDDLQAVSSGYQYIQEFSRQGELHRLRFVINYRFRRKDGQYVHLRDEKITLLTKHQRPVFFILLEETKAIPFREVNLEVFSVKEKGLRKINTYRLGAKKQKLTSREMEVVDLIYRGLTTKEIADTLSITTSTVKKHRYSLFLKANVKNSHALIAYANAEGWL